MNKYLYTLLLAFSSLFMAEAQQLFDLKRCIETGLEQNYSIRIIRNEQQISDNNATPGNAGYLPTVDMSGGFSGNFNNNRNSLQDVNPAKRKAMAVKNEKRFLKQKRNALKNPGYSRHPVKTQASFKRLLKAV